VSPDRAPPAEDPAITAEGEEANKDDGADEDEHQPPPAPVEAPHREVPQVRTVADARALIKRGDSDGALSALYHLRQKRGFQPARAAEIALLIGHLYFDRRWLTDGLKEYRFAVITDPKAKTDGTMIANAIRALGERVTYGRARRLLATHVGRSALPALRKAARTSQAPLVRKRADELAKIIDRGARR
jgi:hypothetical protein